MKKRDILKKEIKNFTEYWKEIYPKTTKEVIKLIRKKNYKKIEKYFNPLLKDFFWTSFSIDMFNMKTQVNNILNIEKEKKKKF